MVDLGFKKTHNTPSRTTSTGQYTHLMFYNISNPQISNEQACAWVVEHKNYIHNLIFNKETS